MQEAYKLGYPLKVLRLSIAVYKLARVIRISGTVSHGVWAWRGITAGSAFATTEMRIVLINVVDRAMQLYPRVNPVLFVDDLAAEMTGPAEHIVEQLGGFIEHIADFIGETGQELSHTKSFCTSSEKKVGEDLCVRWEAVGIGIKHKKRVRVLGAGAGASRRRNMRVLRLRHLNYRKRIGRFRRLRAAGVNTARLVRTGIRALTYGSSITGVPDSLLQNQRRTVGAIAAPGAGLEAKTWIWQWSSLMKASRDVPIQPMMPMASPLATGPWLCGKVGLALRRWTESSQLQSKP